VWPKKNDRLLAEKSQTIVFSFLGQLGGLFLEWFEGFCGVWGFNRTTGRSFRFWLHECEFLDLCSGSVGGYLCDVHVLFYFFLQLCSPWLELSNELSNTENGLKSHVKIFLSYLYFSNSEKGVYWPFQVFNSSFESSNYADFNSKKK
jgi:hypothetical protein